MSNEQCQELKNIQYQTMLINNKKHNNNNMNNGNNKNINEMDNISKFLSKKKISLIKKPWNKLSKGEKMKKIRKYVDKYKYEHKLNDKDTGLLLKYLKSLLERKQLQRSKDVIYNIDKQIIESIPGLSYNKKMQKFTLKRVDKKASSLKSLAPKKTK
tara:strand:+ start:766 stop:1236 length:471 start_codon:yes stop_codon:yes gene_type:complete